MRSESDADGLALPDRVGVGVIERLVLNDLIATSLDLHPGQDGTEPARQPPARTADGRTLATHSTGLQAHVSRLSRR